MLVLSRKLNEVLMIGDDIKFTILNIQGNKVRIGIEAPKETPVHHQEVYERIVKNHKNKKDSMNE